MRRLFFLLSIAAMLPLVACGSIDRDNPPDPGLELIATLPTDLAIGPGTQLFAEVRYTTTAADLKAPITGTMNLVGERARAIAHGVPDGLDRRVHIEVFDHNRIRTLAASDTIDIEDRVPSVLFLRLVRLTGEVELTSVLPPEIVNLSVRVVVDVDTLIFDYEIEDPRLHELIGGTPTGTRVRLLVRGHDAGGSVLVSEDVRTDVRDDLLAAGAVAITANFPDYVPIVAVDRRGDRVIRQLPIFGEIPGDPGCNDLRQVIEVRVPMPWVSTMAGIVTGWSATCCSRTRKAAPLPSLAAS